MTPDDDDLTPDPETLADDIADDAHTERWREERARGRLTTQPIVVEPDWRLACEWLVGRSIFFAAQSTVDEHWYAASSDDLLDLIARVRADERERAAGRVAGLSSFFAPGPWITRDLKPCLRVGQALAAIRGDGA